MPVAPRPRLRAPFVDAPVAEGAGGKPGGGVRLGAVPPLGPARAAARREPPVVRAVRLGAAGEPAPPAAPPAAVTPVPLPLPRAAGTPAVPHESRTEEPQP
ncbi:hypothetical protein [Streptomyces termitum]|uniref:hypothetical protein n=1 Tax=Streptomyces termitum TaxID=67368 RepID=UPI0037A898AE